MTLTEIALHTSRETGDSDAEADAPSPFAQDGGALYVEGCKSLSLTNTRFTDNKAPAASALFLSDTDSASASDTSFTSSAGVTVQAHSPMNWHCSPGRWLQQSGAFTGNVSAPACKPCAPGYYGRANNHITAECSGQCPEGFFCVEGTANPQHCGVGHYNPVSGAASATSCIKCGAGHYQNMTGQADCKPCVGGTYLEHVGETACKACLPGFFCPLRASQPLPCDAGTFSNSTALTNASDCTDCPAGSACSTGSVEATPCSPGSVAKGTRNHRCELCSEGSYQDQVGQEECYVCQNSSFCPAGSTLELAALCVPGTYVNKTNSAESAATIGYTGGRKPDACRDCPAGFSCAGGDAQPTECSPGTFAEERQSQCTKCVAGTNQNETRSVLCDECEAGYYARYPGQGRCILCPYPLSSTGGSETCSICMAGYYLNDPAAEPDDIFQNPTGFCPLCPTDADCSESGTTVETLGVPKGFWRASKRTAKIYPCNLTTDRHACSGSEEYLGDASGAETPGFGCDEGYMGPLCEWCVNDTQYFDKNKGCVDCPSARVRFGQLAAICCASAATALLVFLALTRTQVWRRFGARVASRLALIESRVGFQPKLKILVSFYQVVSNLGPIYGEKDSSPTAMVLHLLLRSL